MSDHFVEECSVSLAWGRALQVVASPGRTEMAPLTVSICGASTNDLLSEHPVIRNELDKVLVAEDKQTVETVANTIFPYSLWNPARERQLLFDRYMAIYPQLQRNWQNRRGTYFQRMVANGRDDAPNQLEFVLDAYGNATKGMRRSVLQVAVFDPRKDQTAARRTGFPCLQHLSFVPSKAEGLSVNAFYASQFMVERAYGNYLGICQLGGFVAHELGIRLTRVTCHIGLALLDTSKSALADVLAAVEAEIGTQEG